MRRNYQMARSPMPGRSQPMPRQSPRNSTDANKTTFREKSPPRRTPNRDTGFPAPVRKLIDWRDSDYGQLPPGYVRCQACGRVVRKGDAMAAVRQHRIARHAGGTRDPRVSALFNGVWMCGNAVLPKTCNGRAEARDPEMYDRGFWREQEEINDLPFIPLIRWDGKAAWPTSDGGYIFEAPAGVS